MLKQRQTLSRLMLLAAALNVAGILCLNAATRAPETPAAAAAATPELGYAGWSRGWASLLDSLGFTLMMPGIFFASSVFVGAHVLAWNERATRGLVRDRVRDQPGDGVESRRRVRRRDA